MRHGGTGARRWFAARHHRAASGRLERLGQRGQALIEFCFVMIVMMFLIAGVTDVATLLDLHESVVYAARQGARTGAVVGSAAQADCVILGAVQSALINQPNFTLNTVYIYQATASADGSRAGAAYDEYNGTATCDQNGNIVNVKNPTQSETALVTKWPASARNNTPFNKPPTIDSIGVELDYSYQFQLNVIGTGAFTSIDYAVFEMDPNGLPTAVPTAAA